MISIHFEQTCVIKQDIFYIMSVCVCVCEYVCEYVCVCVCVRPQRDDLPFSFSFPLPLVLACCTHRYIASSMYVQYIYIVCMCLYI